MKFYLGAISSFVLIFIYYSIQSYYFPAFLDWGPWVFMLLAIGFVSLQPSLEHAEPDIDVVRRASEQSANLLPRHVEARPDSDDETAFDAESNPKFFVELAGVACHRPESFRMSDDSP